MIVTRKTTFEADEILIGDRIEVTLKDFGRFTATAQKVTDTGILFLFDEAIDKQPMNNIETSVGGFECSDLKRWLRNTVLSSFPEDLRDKVTDITLPTYGEIFGHDCNIYLPYSQVEPDEDSQFRLMKKRNNRICNYDKRDYVLERWWLRNAAKQDAAPDFFAGVYGDGYAACYNASDTRIGVRPEFWITK